MKSPRQLFCETPAVAREAMDAIAATATQRALSAAFAQVAWGLSGDALASSKLAGARALIDALNVIGVPVEDAPRSRFGLLQGTDEPGPAAGKGE